MGGCKKGHRQPKHLPYGATKGHFWCNGCDKIQVPEWTDPNSKHIKKRIRQKSKKEIKDVLKDL